MRTSPTNAHAEPKSSTSSDPRGVEDGWKLVMSHLNLKASYCPDAPNSPWVPQNHRVLRVQTLPYYMRVRPLHMRVQGRIWVDDVLGVRLRIAPFRIVRSRQIGRKHPRAPRIVMKSMPLAPHPPDEGLKARGESVIMQGSDLKITSPIRNRTRKHKGLLRGPKPF